MSSYFLWFLLLLLPFLFLKAKTIFSKRNHIRLPPGPWTLPVIGSIHHLIGRGLPQHAFRRLSQRYGDLMFLQLGEIPTVVANSREAAREILKTHDLQFCSRAANPTVKIVSYNLKDVAFAPYGEYWREMRKICVLELLSAKRVQSFKSIREEEVKNLIQGISSLSSAGKVFNLSERLFNLTNDVTVRSIMGNKSKDQDLLLKEVRKSVELTAPYYITNMFPSSRLLGFLTESLRKAEEFCNNCRGMFDKIIREHREKEGDGDVEDLLMVLLRLHDESLEKNLHGGSSEKHVLTIESIKGVIFDVITGGTETSGATIDFAMTNLMKNPRVMRKVQAELRQQLQGRESITESNLDELSYFHLVIKETLRLHPPVPMLIPRECRETYNVLGYDIPKGAMVIVNAWAMGRDSRYWKDAEEFKPERFEDVTGDVFFSGGDFEYLPFGAGRRMCPGVRFGLATVELALANLLYHFDWKLPPGMPDKWDMSENFGLAASRKSSLYLQALPYKH